MALTKSQRRAYEAAYYVEHAKLNDSLARLTRRRVLLREEFKAGLLRGVLITVGLAMVLTIGTAALGAIGDHVPGPIGDWALSASQSLKNK